jgi:hypothetical protein
MDEGRSWVHPPENTYFCICVQCSQQFISRNKRAVSCPACVEGSAPRNVRWHYDIFRKVEWGHDGVCLICKGTKDTGHGASCDMGRVLKDAP